MNTTMTEIIQPYDEQIDLYANGFLFATQKLDSRLARVEMELVSKTFNQETGMAQQISTPIPLVPCSDSIWDKEHSQFNIFQQDHLLQDLQDL